jgi:hypothetical protein
LTTPAAGSSSAAGLPVTVDALSAVLVALYTDAEVQLLDQMSRAAAGPESEMLAAMRRAAQRVVNQLMMRSGPLVQQIVDTAAERGDQAAWAMLRRTVEGHPSLARLYLAPGGHAAGAANMIRLELQRSLTATWSGILRWTDDVYRTAVAQAAMRLVRGREGLTPASAQQAAWSTLTRHGVTGYRDTAGRNWNLATYVEMATRTAVQRAYNAAADARYAALGIQYFTISHDGHPCPLCRPFEGAVLSHGRVGPVVEAAANDGRPVAFTVKATVEQARIEGLFHPNCRHTLQPYLPGVTMTSPARAWSKADQARYDATQRLRALERQVRAAKREQAAALTPAAKQQAARNMRRAQARIRDHVTTHGLVRRSRREHLDLGNR